MHEAVRENYLYCRRVKRCMQRLVYNRTLTDVWFAHMARPMRPQTTDELVSYLLQGTFQNNRLAHLIKATRFRDDLPSGNQYAVRIGWGTSYGLVR